jgi:hypothetical protein
MEEKLYHTSLQILWLFPMLIALAAVVLMKTEDMRQERHLRTLLFGGLAYLIFLSTVATNSEVQWTLPMCQLEAALQMQVFLLSGFMTLVLYLLVILFLPSKLA